MAKKKILVIGSSNTDMTIKGERLPLPGETVLGGEFKMGPGGKGANQAVAASRLGGDVTFICKVGRDLFGDNSINLYNKEGMDTSHILRSDKPSGIALILVDAKAENCISVAPGANGDITVSDIEKLEPVIAQADYVILQLEITVAAVVKAAQIAKASGAYVILNPAPACPLPAEIFSNISLITPNQTEIALMTGIEVSDEDSLHAAVRKIQEMGVKDVVVTLGSKGSLVCQGSDFIFVPSQKVKAVDTTAAGDTFCGGIAVGLSEGMTLEDAAAFATKASALTVQKMGAQDSIPYRKDIK
ncbi:MAG: ribokinase [Bacteroidales bacterium]|nr:ribokinase [Bacteroidales bacterium]